MEVINKLVVLPEEGEVMEFEETYGFAFGDRNRRKLDFGRAGTLDVNPKAICVMFKTPAHTETQSGFLSGMSELAERFGFPITTVVSTKPYGAGEIIKQYEGSFGQDLLFFVSKDGKTDPFGQRTETVWDPEKRKLVVRPAPPRMGLKSSTVYYITRYWRVIHDGGNPPLGLEYMGTDDPEHGGEVPIADIPVPVEVPTDTQQGYRIDLGPMGPGIFVPDSVG